MNCIWILLLILMREKHVQKKPLVITSRIKRMYITYLIIFAVIACLVNMLDLRVALVILSVMGIFAYCFVK